jgi:hypothetical protein
MPRHIDRLVARSICSLLSLIRSIAGSTSRSMLFVTSDQVTRAEIVSRANGLRVFLVNIE